MTIFVPITLFGWPLVGLLLFCLFPPRKAALWTMLLAWLFLPIASYKFPMMPNYDKVAAASMTILLAALIFDNSHITRFRPSWFDLPILILCAVPFFSCLSSGLGVIAGLASVAANILTWGVPYLIGRIYFNDAAGIRVLAVGVVLGGLIYVPFCLYEIRMAPVLHSMIYGFHPGSFIQERRYGGYRPVVFMQHGLAVAAWMGTAATLTFWIWRMRVRYIAGTIPVWLAVITLLGMVVLCKSFGAVVTVLIGISLPFLTKRIGFRAPLLILALAAPSYMVVRTFGILRSDTILGWSRMITDEERTASLSTRLHSEDNMLPRLLDRPLFGYGWGQYQFNKVGERDSITDGMWIIIFGRYGLIGLTTWSLLFLLPAMRLCLRKGSLPITDGTVLLAVGLSVLLCLHLLDNLMNAMFNPVFLLIAGGLMSLCPRLAAANRPVAGKAQPQLAQRPAIARRPQPLRGT